ncbi:MAG: 3-phosphoshikimate 1-carboxyvinyltransferase [Treponema sp.]|nr:3-phosphoshikimate 1-carboxyvinyltransferase [Treponema sp.]
MTVSSSKTSLSGRITVPGSKSHTIRALLLASLADGVSEIKNPLPSADCLSTAAAVPLIGAEVNLNLLTDDMPGTSWIVTGAGKDIHLPDDVINVGNSGSLLYFLSPVAATLDGWSVFTGDDSIKKRPVNHVVDVLHQLGTEAFLTRPGSNGCPMVIKGGVKKAGKIVTGGTISSQYISGLMFAALRMEGGLEIELTDPKETPYLTMTKVWLEYVGASVTISEDFKHITVKPASEIKAFNCTIPSDWEAVAFPLIAALITDSDIYIDNIDGSGTQGDDEIVKILQSVGADIEWDRAAGTLHVRGGAKARNGLGRLSTENLAGGELHVAMSDFPDAICALAVIACFTEGTTVLEDAAVCRRKETDRIAVMAEELAKLGADVEAGDDYLKIHGHAPLTAAGEKNPAFALHPAVVKSYDDHRVAMSLSCMGLALPRNSETSFTGNTTVEGAECCKVSFPGFYESMNALGAGFMF